MRGDKDIFSDLEEKDFQMHINMGNDGRYNATGMVPLPLRGSQVKHFNVMHVPGLKETWSQSRCWRTKAMTLFSVMEKLSCDIKQRVKARG